MSAYDDDAGSIRHEWDEDPDEEEIVADAQRRAARGARSSSGVDALRAEVRRLRGLPVIRTCGDCGWNAADLVTDHCVHDDRDTEDNTINVHDAPPSWCPMRGGSQP